MRTDPEIQQAVDAIQVINTHEHQVEEAELLRQGDTLDFFKLFRNYAISDLASAGMPKESMDKCQRTDVSPEEKWRLFEPYYLASKNTAYMKAVRLTIRDLYGIEDLNSRTYASLTDRVRARNKPGVLRWILREKCNIRVSQVNALDATFFRRKTDADLFQQDLSVAKLLNWPIPFDGLANTAGVSITSFKSYGQAIDRMFELYAPLADAVKQQSAYWRMQNFDNVSDGDAEQAFEAAMKNPKEVPAKQQKVFQDWSFHRCIQRCIDHDLPIKIHTGYAAGHNGMWLDNLKPWPLSNLFIKYPQAKFDLFHIGYPFQGEIIALAKHFTSVYADMCWAWIIDWHASIQFLKQFLTAVPASKLFAFGGDYGTPEPVYGHLRMARNGIARALSELVEEDYFTKDEAIAIAHRVLHDNAAVVFKVDAKIAALKKAQSQPAS